jgi:hypothetical protein
MVRIKWFWGMLLMMLAVPVFAQDSQALLALRSDTTELQTGEYYTVRIEIDNVEELWSTTMQISYDPTMLYIVGTESGSPVELGNFLSDGGLVIQNNVNENNGTLRYTPSRLAPADPVSGNGVIGTFVIFPLQSGQATLSFTDADMSRVIFTTNEQGFRTVQESVSIPFAVTQLDFTITGEMVTPPPEATATPTPSPSPVPIQDPDEPTFTPEPTLVVVTDAPANGDAEAVDDSSTPTLLYVAVGFVLVALVGLGVMFVVMRRRGSKS